MRNAIFFCMIFMSACVFGQTIISSKCDGEVRPEKATGTDHPIPKGVYTVVDQMPEYPTGDKGLTDFIINNLRYPEKEREADIQGRVVVGFIVNEDGSLSDINIKKGITPEMNKEALRLVNLLPRFTAGRQNGKPVKVSYMLPIMFKLNTQ